MVYIIRVSTRYTVREYTVSMEDYSDEVNDETQCQFGFETSSCIAPITQHKLIQMLPAPTTAIFHLKAHHVH